MIDKPLKHNLMLSNVKNRKILLRTDDDTFWRIMQTSVKQFVSGIYLCWRSQVLRIVIPNNDSLDIPDISEIEHGLLVFFMI
jgi:hypothetical protein